MTAIFFTPAPEADTARPGSSIAETHVGDCQKSQSDAVSLGLHDPISEAEIDHHIKSLGELADLAYKAGDKDTARNWMTAMYAAIKGRSPAHQARLQAEADKRVDEGVCYFSSDAARELGRRRFG